MRLFPLIVFLSIGTFTLGQTKQCDFSIDSRNTNLVQLADSLEAVHLKTFDKKKSIPKFIKRTLNCWTNKFDIANPNKPYQASDAIEWRIKPLPSRQLTYLGKNDRYLIITYKKGGFAATDHILIFKFEKRKLIDFWSAANARLSSQEEVIYFLKNHSDILQSNGLSL